MKKIDKYEIIDNWNELPLRKYLRVLQDINDAVENNISPYYLSVAIIANLADIDTDDVMKMPLKTFQDLENTIQFLQKEPEKTYKTELNLNGNNYTIVKDAKNVTTAQFIDIQELTKKENYKPENFEKVLSAVIVPKGKVYGDYDIEAVQNDILVHLSTADALDILFFYQTLNDKYLTGFQQSIQKKKEKAEKILKIKKSLLWW